MRLAALVDSPEHVCARYRMAAFRPFLEQAGHSLTLIPWPRPFPSRLIFDKRLWQADVVIVQRRLLSTWHLFLLRRAAKRLWFDFDDAVFLRDSYHPKGAFCRRLQRGFARMVAASEFILAGNRFLAQNAGRFADPRRVNVVPTCVDVGRYCPSPRVGKVTMVNLVWIGSSSTMKGLELVRHQLEELGKKNRKLNFRIICDRSLNLEHLPVLFHPWSEETEAEALARADIGLSWIPDDDWSRGKCGLKVLQYMAAGLPVVANTVGVHPEIIEHGRTGLLANSPQAWADALQRLIEDEDLRQRLGQAGRKRAEQTYHVVHGAARWLELLNDSNPAQRRQPLSA